MTHGNPMKLLILFALPMMIGSVFQSLYSTVDSVVVGRFVSASALGAIGATASFTTTLMHIASGITGAISILLSQFYGAKNDAALKRCTVNAIYLSAVCSLVLGLLGAVFARPAMELLGTPADIIDMSVDYLRIICLYYFTQFFYNTAASALRALGDSRTPLYFLILCSILNVLLDLLFVLKFGWGVAGVAYATIISQAVSAIACIVRMFQKYPVLRFGLADMKPDFSMIGRTCKLGFPIALQGCVLSLGNLTLTGVINSFGSDVVAAYAVGIRVEQLAGILFSQFSFSASVYAGQNFGARDFDRIRRGINCCFWLVGGLSLLSCLLVQLFANPIIGLFINAEEANVIAIARRLIRIESAFYPFLGWILMYLNVLKGFGAIPPTMVSAFIELGSKIVFSLILSSLFGSTGIWFAAPIGWALGTIPVAWHYHSGKWKKLAEKEDLQKVAV